MIIMKKFIFKKKTFFYIFHAWGRIFLQILVC